MILVYAAVLLGILIFVHELGHFLVAKRLGVKVLKFSLGFGPKIISRTYGETEYLLSALPLGGYVKMLGEEPGEELKQDELKRAYNHQPVWKRVSIVSSGPIFNLLFAVLIFFLVFAGGVPYLLPAVGEVKEGSPAAQIGLQKDDRIIEINGTPISRWDEMTEIIHNSAGREITLTIRRGEETRVATVIPDRKTVKNLFGEDREVGLIGIGPSGATEIMKESVGGAAVLAFQKTWEVIVLTAVSIVKLIQRVIPADTIGGPILIAQMAGQQASAGPLSFFTFMAIISINLGILNLLPIPVLDGGHILFLGIEALRRRPLSEKVIMMSQRVGLALLLMLMAFAFYNDIIRLVTGKMF